MQKWKQHWNLEKEEKKERIESEFLKKCLNIILQMLVRTSGFVDVLASWRASWKKAAESFLIMAASALLFSG